MNRICDLSIKDEVRVDEALKMQDKLFSSSLKDINKKE